MKVHILKQINDICTFFNAGYQAWLSVSFFSPLHPLMLFVFSSPSGLSGAMASISVRSGAPGSPTHVSGSSSNGGGAGGGGSSGSGPVCRSRRNGLQDVDLNTFISEEMALHLDSTGSASAGGGGTRKRNSTQCSDVITDSPTHKRNRMIWSAVCLCVLGGGGSLQSQGWERGDGWAYGGQMRRWTDRRFRCLAVRKNPGWKWKQRPRVLSSV